MVICVAVDCNSDSRQGKAYVFINFQGTKSETGMADKNKTYKNKKTCQNGSCLLLRLKSWLEKDMILAGRKSDFLPHTFYSSSNNQYSTAKEQKLTKTMLSASPSLVFHTNFIISELKSK